MGFRFRKSFKIAPGVKLNLNKKSAGLTFGGKGAHFTMNTKGKNTTSVGVPGTGLYYTSTSGGGSTGSGGSGGNGGNHYGNNYNMPFGGNYGGGNNYNNNFTPPQKPQKNYTAITILLLIFFFPLGLYFMWAKTNWHKAVKIIISSFFGVIFLISFISSFVSDSSSLPASSSGITEIHSYEDKIRLDAADMMNDEETVEFHFSVQGGDAGNLLNSDFVPVFSDDDIATAEVYSIIDYSYEVWIKVKAKNPGTTTMYVETYDGTVKSEEITVEVVGEKPELAWTTEPAADETQPAAETTERETERTTESTTKDTSITVYITPTGSKYHYSRSCAGDNAIETTLNQVKDTYEPCGKCVN